MQKTKSEKDLSIKRYKFACFIAKDHFNQLCHLLKSTNLFKCFDKSLKFVQVPEFYDIFNCSRLIVSLESEVCHQKPPDALRLQILRLFPVTNRHIHQASILRQQHHLKFTEKDENGKHTFARENWTLLASQFFSCHIKFEKCWAVKSHFYAQLPSPTPLYATNKCPKTPQTRKTYQHQPTSRFIQSTQSTQSTIYQDADDLLMIEDCIKINKFQRLMDKWQQILPSTQYCQIMKWVENHWNTSLWNFYSTLHPDPDLYDTSRLLVFPCVFEYSSQSLQHGISKRINELYHSKRVLKSNKQLAQVKSPEIIQQAMQGMSLFFLTYGDYHLPMSASSTLDFIKTLSPHALFVLQPSNQHQSVSTVHPKEVIVDFTYGLDAPLPDKRPLSCVYVTVKNSILQYSELLYENMNHVQKRLNISINVSPEKMDQIMVIAFSTFDDCYPNLKIDADTISTFSQLPNCVNSNQNRFIGTFFHRCLLLILLFIRICCLCDHNIINPLEPLTIDDLLNPQEWVRLYTGPIFNDFHRIALFLYY